MLRRWKDQKWLPGTALFSISFLYLYWIAGDVLKVAGDEGIYLQGGRLVALGQQPYRDFFALTGPLSFWIEGALAFCSGMSLAVMRLPPIIDAAFLALAVYWLVSRYSSVLYSAGTAVAFLAYEARVRQLVVNHRWDSAALAMAAILLAERAHRTGRMAFWTASGFLIVAAAFATPSMLWVAISLLLWSGWRNYRRALALFAGGSVAAAIAAGYLQVNHALLPMVQAMLWTGAHYAQANRVFYGGLFMSGLFDFQTSGWQGAIGYSFSLLPAILPIAAILGWAWYLGRTSHRADVTEFVPMLMVIVALLFSAWPRWTAEVLLHTLAFSWSLCAVLFYRLTTPSQRRWFCLVVLLGSLGSLADKAMATRDYWARETRVGPVRASNEESEFLAGMERWVQPGDTLFSYPYLASAYYLLDARNPTRYSFLQPGMMTAEDERRAITELEAAPPQWVLYEDYPAAAVLAIWPGSDPALIPMEAINSYLRQNYHAVGKATGPWGHVVVLENKPVR